MICFKLFGRCLADAQAQAVVGQYFQLVAVVGGRAGRVPCLAHNSECVPHESLPEHASQRAVAMRRGIRDQRSSLLLGGVLAESSSTQPG